MKNRIAGAFPPAGPSDGKRSKEDLHIMRLHAARMVRADYLQAQEMRDALNLLLADSGALADEELECLHEKLTWKSLKK